jgi:DNA-binding response OmpR family regulator
LLRRPSASLDTVLSSGNVTLNTATRSVLVGEEAIEATPREVTLLESLLRREGQVVARTALENSLYAMSAEVTPNALEATMSRLRKRLAGNAANIEIKTVHGIGYALYSPKQHHD